MSWSVFHLFSAGMITFLLLLVIMPFWWQKNQRAKSRATNVALIRQRLDELSREASEGLISEHDQRQAADELKLALVDEHAEENTSHRPANIPLVLSIAGLVIAIGVYVYLNVNQLEGLQRQQDAVDALPSLSEQLAKGDSASFDTTDVQDLAIAIRHRLQYEPDDAQGWMFLGRLSMSLGQQEQALNALEKAFTISDDPQIATNYVRGLLATEQRANIAQAQSVLSQLMSDYPDNTNYTLMMAVTSAQLGDLPATRTSFNQIKNLLPADNSLKQDLESRIQQMENAKVGNEPAIMTRVSLTINLGSNVNPEQLPSAGFLVVFAQNAANENRMPAAVVKLPLPAFPVTVTLSDSDAMIAGYTLGDLSQVRLVARISQDEDVAVATGEWEGSLEIPLQKGQSVQQSLIINKEL